jgi:hypothetical protein
MEGLRNITATDVKGEQLLLFAGDFHRIVADHGIDRYSGSKFLAATCHCICGALRALPWQVIRGDCLLKQLGVRFMLAKAYYHSRQLSMCTKGTVGSSHASRSGLVASVSSALVNQHLAVSPSGDSFM